MSDQNKKKQNEGVNPIAAAVGGAVVGATLAAGAAYALSSEKNRNKVKKVLGEVKDQAVDYVENLEGKAGEAKDQVEKKIEEAKKK